MSLKYQIGGIGWYNFETLVQTLLKGVIGPGVTSFGGSKDGGRDAAFTGSAPYPSATSPWSGSWVFQVKYVDLDIIGARDAARALLGAFAGEIRTILARRTRGWRHDSRPDNYVLLTNVPLTARERASLDGAARAAGLGERFAVIDGREVCEWLDLYPDVRRAYPQLLALADLGQIVNAEVLGRSRAYLDQWQPKLAMFVATEAYRQALTTLRARHFVVLDGAPEVGKSTIAASVALQYASAGFEIVDVRRAGDVYQIYRADASQLFVADDAVGSVALDPSATEQWSRDLPGVLRRLDKRHLLVWTGRSYILAEAVAQSRLGDAVANFPGVHHVLVTVGALQERERAAMLYNHAKFARLSDSARALVRRLARSIVQSPDLTPERLRQLTSDVLTDGRVQPETVLQFLANPGRRWIQAYRNLSASERALLGALLDTSGQAPVSGLRDAYASRAALLPGRVLPFEESLARLSPGFLRQGTTYGGAAVVDFQHPSLRDVLLTELRDDASARRQFFALASPAALAAVARGIGAQVRSSADVSHAVTPADEDEARLLVERIGRLAAAPLPADAWHQLLIAGAQLVPATKADPAEVNALEFLGSAPSWSAIVPVPPPSVDLDAFGRTVGGQLLDGIVRAFASRDVFDANRRYDLSTWAGLLDRFTKVVVYVSPLPHVEYAGLLAAKCVAAVEADPSGSASCLAWLRQWEPLTFQQWVGEAHLATLATAIRDQLAELVSTGRGLDSCYDPYSGAFPDGDEYAEWSEQTEEALTLARAFFAWASEFAPPELDALEDLQRRVSGPPEPDDDGESLSSPGGGDDYWTVERLFEDL